MRLEELDGWPVRLSAAGAALSTSSLWDDAFGGDVLAVIAVGVAVVLVVVALAAAVVAAIRRGDDGPAASSSG